MTRNMQNLKRSVVIVAVLGLLFSIIWLARGAVPPASPATSATPENMRFIPVDVELDSGANELAAYQVEITSGTETKIVGLEGGAHPAFRAAPYYDPGALPGNRIIFAAFSTSDSLPAGQTRVARLHLAVMGGGDGKMPQLVSKLVVATNARGHTIPTAVSLRASQGDRP